LRSVQVFVTGSKISVCPLSTSPTPSRPDIVSTRPLLIGVSVGYQRWNAMSGTRDHVSVRGSKV
jgi:hypothetical protein